MKTWFVRTLVVFLAILGVAGISPAALACSCLPVDPDEFVRDVAIIFRGTLEATDQISPPQRPSCRGGVGPECAPTLGGRFQVEEIFKGELRQSVIIRHSPQDGVNCGWTFAPGRSVMVAAYRTKDGAYESHLCIQAQFTGTDQRHLQAAERYRARLRELEAAVAATRNDPAPLQAQAQFLADGGEDAAAQRSIDRIVALAPVHRDALLLRARLYLKAGEDERALAALRRVVEADAGDRQALQMLATTLLRNGRIEELPAGVHDFAGLRASGIDLSRRDLSGVSFRGVWLTDVDFSGAILRGTDFSDARLERVRFSGADLTGAVFRRTHIEGQFDRATLPDADLQWASIAKSDFSDATLSGARLAAAVISQSDFARARADRSVFAGARLYQIRFEDTDFSDADLSGVMGSNVSFRDARFAGAVMTGLRRNPREGLPAPLDFSAADLRGAKLDGVRLVAALYDCRTRWPHGFDPAAHGMVPAADARGCGAKPDFSWWRVQPVGNFGEIDLSGVSFRGAVLGGTFIKTDLQGADFTRATGGISFRGTNLRSADFSHVVLSRWNFSDEAGVSVDLRGAKFRGAILSLTHFAVPHDADLRGAIVFAPPSKWPASIDPVKAGIVFGDSATASSLFPGYSLKGADLRGFNLSGGDFRLLDLRFADLRNARIEAVDFRGADLASARLKGALYNDSTKWPQGFDVASSGVVFSGRVNEASSHWAHDADRYRGSSDGAPRPTPPPDMSGENWDEANFLGAWLAGGNLDRSSFVHATLKAASLTGASARQSDFTGADFRDALLDKADLRGARLSGADLRNALLAGALLQQADLRGAIYNGATVWPAGFDPIAAGAAHIASDVPSLY
ncbi:MAG: pentapeptide repeat-containing protein [Reyranellaceae bacterium]